MIRSLTDKATHDRPSQLRNFRIALLIILLLAGAVSIRWQPVQAAPARANSVSDLWLDISLGPPLVNWFNQVARPNDIARVDHVERVGLLDEIQVGRKLVIFKSAAEAEQLMATIAGQVDIVGYNLEHGPANPLDEQADPIESAKRLRQAAQQYGLQLAFGPDHSFALSDGVAIAPYVDIFVLQVQRVQTEPETVRDFVLPLIPQLRQANPNLEISVQVRTEGDVTAITDLIDSLKQELDGVSILTSPETVAVAEALVEELQTRQATNRTVSPSAAKGITNGAAASDDAPVAIQIPSFSGQGENILITQDISAFWIVTMLGALVVGAIGGGLVAFLVCMAKR